MNYPSLEEFQSHLFEMLARHADLQEIIDFAAVAFSAPLWLSDESYLQCVLSREPSSLDLWETLSASLEEQLALWEADGLLREMDDPLAFQVHENQILQKRVLCANVRLPDHRTRYLAIFLDPDREVPQRELVTAAAHAMALAIQYAEVQDEYLGNGRYLSALLDGIDVPVQSMPLPIQALKAKYCRLLVILRDDEQSSQRYLSFLCARLSNMLPDCTLLFRQRQIILLTADPDNVLQLLSHLPDYNSLRVGQSFVFMGFEHLRGYLRQAQSAVEIAAKRELPLVSYEAILETDLANWITQTSDPRPYCLPEVLMAADYDQQNNTAYIATLRAVVDAGGSQKQASDALGIHPNTMKYRVQQMRSLFKLDISSFTTLSRLPLALALLEQMNT